VHDVAFHRPAPPDTELRIRAVVADTGRTSLWTHVVIENAAGASIMDGCFVFVALDAAGRPAPVPPIAPESDEEQRLHRRIRALRLRITGQESRA